MSSLSPVHLCASLLLLTAFAVFVPVGDAADFWFRDVFDGARDPSWLFYVPAAGPSESFDDPAGYWTLYMPTTTTVFDHWSTVDNAPALYLNIPSANQGDDFFIETHLVLDGPTSGNFHGVIVVYFSQLNVFYWGPYMGSYLRVEKSGQNGLLDTTYYDDVYLRIERTGRTYDFLYRTDPTSAWTSAGTIDATETPTRVGLMGKTWGTLSADLNLSFEYFLMNSTMGAYAGPDQYVWAGDTVTLDGSRSYADTFSWQQIAGEPTVTLSNPNPPDGIATFAAPDLTVGTALTFRLTTTGDTGTTTDDTVVTVRAKNAPTLVPQNFRTQPSHLGYRLQWDTMVDAQEYGVGFKMGEDLYFWFWTSNTYYDLLSLTEGVSTTVAVKTRNTYGEGPRSEDITLVPMRNYALPTTLGGTNPPSGYVYAVSHYAISGMNNQLIQDDNNDSWNGSYKAEDYWGYLWTGPMYFDHVTYFTGNMFFDGGWFTDLSVEYTEDGTTWNDVPTVIVPDYDFTDQRAGKTPYTRYDMFIPTLHGLGIRVAGTPGGTATFTSIAELEVYADMVTSRPLVVQGIDGEVPERATGTIDASFSFSTRGDITSMIYSQISGPSVTITVTGDPLIATFEAPGVNADTELVFQITGSDGTDTLSDEVTITVKNLVTTAVAGPDHIVQEATTATLDGSASVTTTGTLTYQWTQTSGDPVTLNNANAAIADFEAPILWAYREKLTFQLQVDDGSGGLSTDEVVIKVRNFLTPADFEVEPIDPADWQFLGNASYNDVAGILELTPPVNDQVGAAWMIDPIDCTEFLARFKVYIGDGNGADGMVFGWVTSPGIGAAGGGMGWYSGGLIGYGVVFDTYPNPSMNRVSFEELRVHTGGDTGGYAYYDPPIDLENSGWFDVEIEMDNGHLQVWMSNETAGLPRTLAIDYTLADYTGFDAYFGFTGATGGLNNNHWVDDDIGVFLPTDLPDAYAVRELPTSYEAGGNVEVSLSLRVNPDDTPSSVTVTEAIPAGLTVVDAGGGTQIGSSLSWSFSGGTVATQVLSYTLGAPGGTSGGLDFTGTITFGGTTDGVRGNTVVYEVPSAPQNLDVQMLLGANVTWVASPTEGVAGYRVYRNVNGQGWEEIAFATGTSYLDMSIEEGSTYNYQVAAVNAGGVEGPVSDASGEKMIVMEVREAENFNHSGGQWPGSMNCPAAIEAPDSATVGTPAEYDFFFATDIPADDYRRNYRPDDNVAMYGYPTGDPADPASDPVIIGWTVVDDWWRYTFNVPAPGPSDPEGGWVKIELSLSYDGVMELYWDETLVGTVPFYTGAWDTYGLFPMEEQFQTTPGEHTLRVRLASGGVNFDKIGVGFNWTKPTREDIFADDFDSYTTLYSFADLVAAGYTVNNGAGVAEGAWQLWNTGGDMLGNEDPALAAMTENYVITDSDLAGPVDVDEELITPNIDCTNHRRVRLDFDYNYRPYPDDVDHAQIAEVDIRSSDDGVTWSDWTNLLGWSTPPATDIISGLEQVDVSAYADGKIIQVRWHSYEANFDYWFAVDDIRVSGDLIAIKPDIILLGYTEGAADLTWNAFGDGNYTVQYTNDLTSDNWQPVPGVTWPIAETTWSGDITGIFGQGVYLRVLSE